MKTSLTVLATLAVAFGAFAQGTVYFGNGPMHLVTLDPRGVAYVKSGYEALAGQPAPQIGQPLDVLGALTATLWAGTTEQNMSLQGTFTPAGQEGLDAGILPWVRVPLTGVPFGPAFFRFYLWETAAGSYEAAQSGNQWWHGSTPVFTLFVSNFAPSVLSSSTDWAGPIYLSTAIPEPSTFVLAGLGIASLLLFRRRGRFECRR